MKPFQIYGGNSFQSDIMIPVEMFIIASFILSVLCFFIAWIFWFGGFIYSLKLLNYLRIKKRKRFFQITHFNKWHGLKFFLDPTTANRGFTYLENNLDMNNKIIFRYKKRLRLILKIGIGFLILFVIFLFAGIGTAIYVGGSN